MSFKHSMLPKVNWIRERTAIERLLILNDELDGLTKGDSKALKFSSTSILQKDHPMEGKV